jgi:hypothetical protein
MSGVSLSSGLAMSVAVERKRQASTREQGQQALQLIEAAIQPQAAAGSVGSVLNITA